MAQSRKNILLNQDLAAVGALLALGQASLGAGGLNSGYNFLSVTGSGDSFLLNQDLAAVGALLAFGQAGLGAGGLNLRQSLGVLVRTLALRLNQDLTADGALPAGGHFVSLGNLNGGMVNAIIGNLADDIRLTADGAGVADLAFLSAGGSSVTTALLSS